MTPIAIALVILVVAAFAAVVFLVANASRQRRAIEDVPPAQRPGYSDEQLETSVIERYMAWGVVLTLFFAVFLPVYWLREPSRIEAKQEEELIDDIVRGQQLYDENCAECHGQNLNGGGAPSPYDALDSWPAPALNNIEARYAESDTITDISGFVNTTIERGRPGTPMPAWSPAFEGPLTDQQIASITSYILSQQTGEVAEPAAAMESSGEDLYVMSCARCHGDNLLGVVGPSLIGVFERHNTDSILGILRNGIALGTGAQMPPWQDAYQHESYTDEALLRIIDYLERSQPAELPPDAGSYQGPGIVGEDFSDDDETAEDGATDAESPAAEPTDV